jgi:hypothetical protein
MSDLIPDILVLSKAQFHLLSNFENQLISIYKFQIEPHVFLLTAEEAFQLQNQPLL